MQCLQLAAVYRVKQQGHVEAARRAILQRADVALSDLVAALPPHRRDLTLIEALNKAIGRPNYACKAELLASCPVPTYHRPPGCCAPPEHSYCCLLSC